MTASQDKDREDPQFRQLKRAKDRITRLEKALEQCIGRTRNLEAANKAAKRQVTDRKRLEEQLRESEERFRNYFNLGLIGMAITSPTKGFLDVNDKICEILGYERSELIQMTWAEMTHSDDLPADAAQFSRVLAGEIDNYSMEKRWIRKDGNVIYSTISVKCLRRVDGSVDHFVALLHDITKRVLAEEDLRKTQAELAHATRVRSLGELSTSIAHELNQPLAAVVMNGTTCLRWLAHEPPNLAKARKAVNDVIQNGKHAGAIIRGVRALLKKNDAQQEKVDVNTTIQEVASLARGEILKNKILLEIDLSKSLPTVWGARVELQQVMLNLVMNAIDAMMDISDRQQKLIIRSQPYTLGDSPSVLIAVQDTGIGVAEENIHQVFEAFYTTKTHGLGMGLAISRSIIEAHGGRLWATRNADHGMKVQFALPGLAEPRANMRSLSSSLKTTKPYAKQSKAS